MKRLLELIGEVDVRELIALARARLARWIAPRRKGAVVLFKQESAYGTECMPPQRTIRLPSAEQLDYMRGVAELHDQNGVKVCRGSKWGCQREQHEMQSCKECRVVPWHERRPSEEILAGIERGDA